MKRILKVILAAVMAFTSVSAMTGCGGDGKIKLYFDGGGGSGNYNSTLSMNQSAANPYPYNTLEKLADEWNAKNDKYEIVINRNSLNGKRDAITSMLPAGTAPDMIYQAGGVINDDLGNGWYANMSDYFNKPNPYADGNKKWADLYDSRELESTKAPDGNIYYVCLDKIAVGLMYNMTLLNAAGITKIPETHSEFIACLNTLKSAKASGKIAADIYIHQGFWHEIHLNNSVFGSKLGEWDEDGNSMVNSYELAKAYSMGEWDTDSAEFMEYLRLCGEKASFYPKNYLAYDTGVKFARNQLAVTDGLGNHMNIAKRSLGNNLAVAGYPRLNGDASSMGGTTAIRGSAGLSTAYWVTTAAINKGQDAVDACADFLMYITAPDNNARMVNDLGFAMPLDVTKNTNPLFDNLAKQYQEDSADAENLMWSAINTFNSFGQEFSDTYERKMGEFYQGKDSAADVAAFLKPKLADTVGKLTKKYNWVF